MKLRLDRVLKLELTGLSRQEVFQSGGPVPDFTPPEKWTAPYSPYRKGEQNPPQTPFDLSMYSQLRSTAVIATWSGWHSSAKANERAATAAAAYRCCAAND